MPKGRRARRQARVQRVAPLPRRIPVPDPEVVATQPLPPELEWYPRVATPAELGTEADDTALTVELAAQLRRIPVCQHCFGRHARACPRVKRMAWHPNSQLAEIEFWPDGKWSDEHVIWPEALAEVDEP